MVSFSSRLSLLDIPLVVNHPVVEGLRIAGQSLGPKRTHRARQLHAQLLRIRDWHRLFFRVDVDRSDIQAEVRVSFAQIEPRDARDAAEHRQHFETHFHPVAILTFSEHDPPAGDIDPNHILRGIDVHCEWRSRVVDKWIGAGIFGFPQRIDRPVEVSLDTVIADRDVNDVAAAQVVVFFLRIAGEVVEHAKGIDQVGSAHAAYGPGRRFLDRKIRRNFDHARGDALLGQVRPEGPSVPAVNDAAAAQRNLVVPEGNHAAARLCFPD